MPVTEEVLKSNDVVLRNVHKYFGEVKAVVDFNLEVAKGEYCGFVGPSGCGKTTTLRMISGLEIRTMGEIYIQGREVGELSPAKRDTSMMFQNFALFPHMTVEQNVEFGLVMRHVPPEERKKRVGAILEVVGLHALGGRKPRELSGGQQQRVALARALVTEPPVLLLDEPLGSLDEILRVKMRGELKNLQRRLGITFIHVTHNQEEVLAMGDKVVVMSDGLIEQIGTPVEVYSQPRTKFVASFIGDNMIYDGEVVERVGTICTLKTQHGVFKVDTDREIPEVGKPAAFSVRADVVTDSRLRASVNKVEAQVRFIEYTGFVVKSRMMSKTGMELMAKMTQEDFFQHPHREGDQVAICWEPKAAVLLPAEETKRLFL